MLELRRIRWSFGLAVFLASAAWAGCGNTPKPKQLKELERILGEQGASDVKEAPGARKPYEEARELRRAALDEWEENDIEEARQYAIRGKIKYRTAETKAKQVEAKKRFEKSKSKLQRVNPKVTKLDEERKKLRREVQDLHREVQKAQQEKARARKKRLEDREDTDSEDQKLAAQNQIERALSAKNEALKVRANEFAKGMFNRAENEYKSARSFVDSESYSQAEKTAKSAKSLFEKASKKAQPKFEEQKAKEQPKKRLSSLEEKLKYNFGDRQVERVSRGVRVIIPELFSKGAEQIASGKRENLESLADLGKKFDEFDVEIEGYTREGNATENLTISQVRAQKVKAFLEDNGVSSDRISSNGKGQSNPRYENTPSMNDRVEVTFRNER